MTAHKNAEMIKAKADNMELVVFFKDNAAKWKKVDSQLVFPTTNSPYVKYFLCHPKHADVCLHWLNGGGARFMVSGDWECIKEKASFEWNNRCVFLDELVDIRIKPRKEKRWIVVKNGMLQSNHLFKSDNEAAVVCGFGGQFIEIEVEV